MNTRVASLAIRIQLSVLIESLSSVPNPTRCEGCRALRGGEIHGSAQPLATTDDPTGHHIQKAVGKLLQLPAEVKPVKRFYTPSQSLKVNH
jgi:hypothetical protein